MRISAKRPQKVAVIGSGLFSIIAFVEHSGGVHHPKGGLNRISAGLIMKRDAWYL